MCCTDCCNTPYWLSLLFTAKSDDGQELRKELKTLLPHIRVCSVGMEDFCRDIAPTGVLSNSENTQIYLYYHIKNHKPVLPEICDITERRTTVNSFIKSQLLTLDMVGCIGSGYLATEVIFYIVTHGYTIELCSLVLCDDIYNKTSKVCRVVIEQSNCCAEPSRPVSMIALVEGSTNTFHFPATSDDSASVILLRNSQYRVTMSSFSGIRMYSTYDCHFSSSHFYVRSYTADVPSTLNMYGIKAIHYKTLTPKWTWLIVWILSLNLSILLDSIP